MAHIDRGNVLLNQGRLEEAEESYRGALKLKAGYPIAHNNLGNVLWEQGRLEEAETSCRSALRLKPDYAIAHNNLANVLRDQQRLEESEASCRSAIELEPDSEKAHNSLGNVLRDQRRLEEAEASCRRALQLKPNFAFAHNNLGNVLRDQGRLEEAEFSCRRAIELEPDFPMAHSNLGNVLREQDRLEEAEASCRRALQLDSDYSLAHDNLGCVLWEQRRLEEAETSYRRALQLEPDYASAHSNLANVLRDQRRLEEAEASCQRAIELKPDLEKAHNNLGNVLWEQGRLEDAEASYRRAVKLRPDYALSHSNLANTLGDQSRLDEAIASYRCAIELEPNHATAFSSLTSAQRKICDWSDFAEASHELTTHVRKARSKVDPFSFLSFSEEPGDQLLCARQHMEHEVGARLAPTPRQTIRTGGRIRLGYLSADFHNHATAYLMAELFELHDRKRFEIFAFSFGPDEQSPMRLRLRQAFDHFIDVRNMSDADAAGQIRNLGIDIAIDLKGHTKDARPKILADRPAPVQVNYLGYPGTMGASFIDYIMVDRFIVPLDQQTYFAEKLVYLPDCYQVNDSKRAIAESPPSRASCGLPESGFVFCCFCNNYKITPAVFDVWMRLLGSIPESVLWLLRDNEPAERNLRREARERDIEPNRLVFAPRLNLQDHLARQVFADLFLDTMPYNAHTTASDALWVGLPVLTCLGRTFPARVSSSLLHAVGLPELVTNSLEDYEALAFRLASDPVFLGTIRTKLALNRETAALFDTNRFRLNIEAAYTEMWRSWESGQAPRTITVRNQRDEQSAL